MSHYQLDTRGLLCPLPVIRTQDRVAQLACDDTLEVVCTDPGAAHDIPAWCRVNGHEVTDIKKTGDEILVTVKICQQ